MCIRDSQEDAQGFKENREAARKGGETARKTREDMERQIGASIITGNNFLPDTHQPKLLGDESADA